MTLGRRINDALGRLLLVQTPSAIDYSRDIITQGKGGHGKHGTTSTPPSGAFARPAEQPLVVWWANNLERIAIAIERDVETETRGGTFALPSHDTRSAAYKEATARITSSLYEGRDPTFVAFLEHRTTEGVRKLRQRKGLDPDTGSRVPSRNLTAPIKG